MANSDGSVEVRITGSVNSSLQASTVEASAAVKGMAAEMGAATASTTALAGATIAEAEATKVATAAHTNSRVVTESLAAVHEVMQGRTSRLGGTLMILAQAATGASTGMLLMGAAAAGAVLGIAYLEYEAYRAQKAVQAMAEGFALTGRGAANTADAVKGEIDELEKMPGVTRKIAEATVGWEAAHGEIDDRINVAVDQLLPQYVQWLGEKAPEAIGTLKSKLQEMTSGPMSQAVSAFDALNRTMLRLPPAQQAVIEKMIESGDRTGAVNALLSQLAQQGGGHIDSLKVKIADLDKQITATKADAQLLFAAMSMSGEGAGAAFAGYTRAEAEIEKLQARLKSLQATQSAPTSIIPISSEDVDAQLQKIASNVNLTDAQILAAQVAALTKLDAAENMSAATRQKIQTDLASKQVELARKTSTDIVEASRDRVLQEGLTGSQVVKAEIANDQALLANKRVTAQEKLGVERDLAQKENELHQQGARQEASEQKHAIEQMLEQARESARQEIEAEKQAWEEKKRIDLDNVNTALELDKQSLETKKANLDAEVAAGRITNAQKIQLLREYATIAATDSAQELQNAISSGSLTVTAANEDANKIKLIWARLQTELAQISAQGANATASVWQHADQEILSSEQSLISNIMRGQQSLTQSLAQFAFDLVEKEVEADARMWTEKLLNATVAQGRLTATEQGGFLLNLLFDKQEAASDISSDAAKELSAMQAQDAMTAAVAAGVAARTAIVSGGAAASNTVETTAESKSIANAAYTSAAKAYESVMTSVPPPANIILAPLAAAATFTAVMAYDTIASLDVGTNYVPRDMSAIVHQGERVIPRADNAALIEALRGGGGNSRGGDVHNWSFSPSIRGVPQMDIMKELYAHEAEFQGFIKRLVRNGSLRF